MQGQKGKCKDKKENARTTQKAIPWIAASKSSDQKHGKLGALPGLPIQASLQSSEGFLCLAYWLWLV